MSLQRNLGVTFLCLSLAGCSTIGDLSGSDNSEYFLKRRGPNIMGGLRADIVALSTEAAMAGLFYIEDTPWSLALDIVVLPFTVPYVLLTGAPPREAAPPPDPEHAGNQH